MVESVMEKSEHDFDRYESRGSRTVLRGASTMTKDKEIILWHFQEIRKITEKTKHPPPNTFEKAGLLS
jgi:hypothetical protein